MLCQIFAENHDLALRIVLALDGYLSALKLFMLYELAARHLQMAFFAIKQDQLTIMFQMVSHPHSNHLFYAKFADFDAVEAFSTMVTHFLPGNPCVTTWIEAHYELITTGLFMLGERSIVDLLWTAISVIDAF